MTVTLPRTGHLTIDAQHEVILALLAALKKDSVDPTHAIETLRDYVTDHFREEERLMVDARYPDYEDHHWKHLRFFDTFVLARARFQKDGRRMELVRTLAMLIEAHVREVDMPMARWVCEGAIAP